MLGQLDCNTEASCSHSDAVGHRKRHADGDCIVSADPIAPRPVVHHLLRLLWRLVSRLVLICVQLRKGTWMLPTWTSHAGVSLRTATGWRQWHMRTPQPYTVGASLPAHVPATRRNSPVVGGAESGGVKPSPLLLACGLLLLHRTPWPAGPD